VGAAGLSSLFNPALGSRVPFLFNVLAVAVAAEIAGTASGLIVTALGAAIIHHFTPPSDAYIQTVLLIYGAIGIALSIFGGWRKRTENELRQVRYNLESAQHIANIGSWESDLVGKLWWSSQIYRIFGVAPGSAITPAEFYKLVHPEDRDRVRQAVAIAVKTQTDYDVEHRIVRKSDGEVRYVHQRAKTVTDGRVRLIGSIQDITVQRQAEAATKILRGLLPTCAHCKGIRDPDGNWHRLESYISQHSEAVFSHTLCPDCLKAHYPECDTKADGAAAGSLRHAEQIDCDQDKRTRTRPRGQKGH
jgi:PAS domain S-box-containing protein